MTKGELIEAMCDLDNDAEVRIAVQPNYPFLNALRNVCIMRNEVGEAVGAVIAAGYNEEYTSGIWWNEYDVTVDADGEPIEDEEA